MTHFGNCPRCQQGISPERLQEPIVICNHCGFTEDKNNIMTSDASELRVIKTIFVLSVLMVAGFIHGTQWNQYSAEIIPLKVKELVGVADAKDLRRISDICLDRKKPTCAVSALAQLVQKNDQDQEGLLAYGNLLFKLKDYNKASAVFGQYFRVGGTDLEAAFHYARVLGENQQVEDSSKYFEYILSSKPDKLQVTVTQAYVNMLFNNNKMNEARKVIESIRKKGTNAAFFMEARLKDIKNRIARR